MVSDGEEVVNASGAWNRYEAEAATSRMARAGAELVATFTLASELQADWRLPTVDGLAHRWQF
ncbi:MAG: hypothetical protein CR217_04280 [Beijerinckiaceae bacterium]|nr:MAG: hypothetical protein CR217_04280 [Beijerinckiaceae bacterium]